MCINMTDRLTDRLHRGHDHDLDKVVDFMRNTLKWRDDNNIDTVVRHDILHKVSNHTKQYIDIYSNYLCSYLYVAYVKLLEIMQ